MKKEVYFNEIAAVDATFKVNADTIAALKANYLNAKTGNVDVNGKNLAVKLDANGEVGFGTGTNADGIFGIIKTYEQDGFAAVQVYGMLEEVPVASAIANAAVTDLAVDATGKVVEVSGAVSRAIALRKSDDENNIAIMLTK